MMQRFAVALLVCAGLAGCKQDDAGPIGAQLFTGLGDVVVLDAQIVPSGDNSAQTSGSTITYVVAHVQLTNDSRGDFTPSIDHFYLIDRNGNRFAGKDSGSSIFTGVTNAQTVLKRNEKRTYTVGFRTTDPITSGTISYEF